MLLAKRCPQFVDPHRMSSPKPALSFDFRGRWLGGFLAFFWFAISTGFAGQGAEDGSKIQRPGGMLYESTQQVPQKIQKLLPSAAPKPAPVTDDAVTSFTDIYDAEKIANYYGAKYRRSADYLLPIILHAAAAAKESNVSPFILLAIIAHESNFLHTARNSSGAEGLMQIMTNVHKKRFEPYGGIRMTYVPEVNLKVGATILAECVSIMKSVRGGLRCYAGTINTDDGGFVDFVLGEATMIKKMASKPLAEVTP